LLSYYSETVGGIPGAARLGLETTYWCETYAAALPYLNEHAKPGDMIWVDPLSQNVMVYYQVQGRLRRDVKIAYSPYAPTWPFVYSEYGSPTPATHYTSDFIVLQYRQTLMGSTPENPDRDFYSHHPDFQWVSTHELVYQLSQDGVPIMEIYSNAPAQGFESELRQAAVPVPANWQAFESEAGNFTVQAPPNREFTETIQKVDIASVHVYESFSEEDGSYAIFYLDLPAEWVADPNVSQGLLNSTRDGWLNIIQGILMEERPVSLGGHPGGEAIIAANINDLPVKFKIRYYLVQNRYYQIMVGIPKDRAFPVDTDPFLQSFALLKE
jgi:hypothetical protein